MKRDRTYKATSFALAVSFFLGALILLLPGISQAQVPPPERRTVYLIGDLDSAAVFPLLAYTVVGNDIHLADSWWARYRGIGPVGLAVDEVNENLFVSYESSNIIEVFDATDATPLGSIRLWGTSDLAGMVVHQERGHLYVVDRDEMTVYVFDTVTFEQLDMWFIPTATKAWGLDLMDNWLFITDTTATIRWFDIDSKTEVGNFTQSKRAVAVSVTDYPEPTVYTQAFNGGSSLSAYFTKYTINSGLEENLLIGQHNKGVSCNPALGLGYAVTGSWLHVIDVDTMTILFTKGINGNPTDVLASNVVFGGTVRKTSPTHPRGKIFKGDLVTFKLSVQNRHLKGIHEMLLQDVYDTTQLSFVSANIAVDDPTDDGTLDWSDLIGELGHDLATGEIMDVEVTFQAIEECEGLLEGVNTVYLKDVEDDAGTVLPDASGQFEYAINCKCLNNLECDDLLFCTGQEICNAEGLCESPGNPCPLDDGLWCNGIETNACDEELDECGHENEPCAADGDFCNGEDICNENTDTCTNSGPPCTDDGQFCNGDESCNETTGACAHSGDPCTAGEECNEATDTCDAGELTDDDSPDPEPDDDEDLWPEGKVTGGCCGCD